MILMNMMKIILSIMKHPNIKPRVMVFAVQNTFLNFLGCIYSQPWLCDVISVCLRTKSYQSRETATTLTAAKKLELLA